MIRALNRFRHPASGRVLVRTSAIHKLVPCLHVGTLNMTLHVWVVLCLFLMNLLRVYDPYIVLICMLFLCSIVLQKKNTV